MNAYVRKTWLYLLSSLVCTGVGVLVTSWGAFLLTVIFFYVSGFLFWRGWKARSEGFRFQDEVEWWRKAKNGIEQDPLDPCCVLYGKTCLRHEEAYCTRRRYPKPRVISREELEKIDKAWEEIIFHLENPEFGEEA